MKEIQSSLSSGMTAGKRRSLTLLGLLCFGLADVRDGIGPFLGVYLQGQGWSPDLIGYAMTISGLAAMLCMPFMGGLADKSTHKRGLLALAVFVIVAACGIVFAWTSAPVVWTSKFLQGALSALIAPTLSALTLGMVGQHNYPVQLGRNQAWNHFGNGTTAVLGGTIGYFYGIIGVFYVLAFMGMLSLCCLGGIRPAHIDHDVARGLKGESCEQGTSPASLKLLFTDRALLAIALVVAFFHFGNAAMLPLLGQSAVARFGVNPAAYTAATVVIAQATMLVMALFGAWLAQRKGYGILFCIALVVLPIRGLVAGFYHSEWSVVPVQILDGISNGLLGVATPGIVARLLRGSGHINLGLGVVLTLQAIGASCSTAYGGLVAHHLGYSAAFLALAAAPCVSLAIFLVAKFRSQKFSGAISSIE